MALVETCSMCTEPVKYLLSPDVDIRGIPSCEEHRLEVHAWFISYCVSPEPREGVGQTSEERVAALQRFWEQCREKDRKAKKRCRMCYGSGKVHRGICAPGI